MIARVPDINILPVTVINSTATVVDVVIVVATSIIIETVTVTVSITISVIVIITVATVPSIPAPIPAAAPVDEVTFKPVAFSTVAIPDAMLIASAIAISITEIVSGATFPVNDVGYIKSLLILILIAGPIAAPLILMLWHISTSIVTIHVAATIGSVHACVSLSATSTSTSISTSAVRVAPTVGSILATSIRW